MFHAGVECFGQEWSYGGNEEDATGVFQMPPKYCDMHDYKETHYVGDTTLTPKEFNMWIRMLSTPTYKQEVRHHLPNRLDRRLSTASVHPAVVRVS